MDCWKVQSDRRNSIDACKWLCERGMPIPVQLPCYRTAAQAGGKGSTGRGRVMEVDPTEVHQRVPLFVGSVKEVEYLESFLQ